MAAQKSAALPADSAIFGKVQVPNTGTASWLIMGIILFTAVNAVVPVVLLILLGYILKEKGFINKDFVKTGNKLVFNVCLPCMLFINVYSIESITAINWEIVLYCVLMLVVIFLLGMGTAVITTAVPERRGVILQSSFRSNFAIIGLPLAAALGGDAAMSVAAVLSAFTIPVFNILGVISLSVFVKGADGRQQSVRKILLNIAKNPLIIGVMLGLLCLVIRGLQMELCGSLVFSLQRDLKFLYTALNNLKSLTSPLALIVMGGQFRFSAVRGMFREIVVGTVWRIVLAPAFGIGTAMLLSAFGMLSCGQAEYPALIALFGSPVAISSAIMAAGMGNDGQLATQFVVWTSIGSVVTIFLSTCALMMFGFIAV